jgi:hypothetical protein
MQARLHSGCDGYRKQSSTNELIEARPPSSGAAPPGSTARRRNHERARGLPPAPWYVDRRGSDVTADIGFGDVADHYGRAAAEFDGDGFLDLAMGSVHGPWRLWMNSCGEGSWAEVDFEGPPGNRAGWGAIARLEAGGRVQERELVGTRGYGQGPSRLYFGLGELETIEGLAVVWPDGTTDRWEDLPVRATFTARHPGADVP